MKTDMSDPVNRADACSMFKEIDEDVWWENLVDALYVDNMEEKDAAYRSSVPLPAGG